MPRIRQQIPRGRHRHQHAWQRELMRSSGTGMTMQTPEALQQSVYGAQVGNKQASIQVEADPQLLRPDDKKPPIGRVFPQSRSDRLIQEAAVLWRKPTM